METIEHVHNMHSRNLITVSGGVSGPTGLLEQLTDSEILISRFMQQSLIPRPSLGGSGNETSGNQSIGSQSFY